MEGISQFYLNESPPQKNILIRIFTFYMSVVFFYVLLSSWGVKFISISYDNMTEIFPSLSQKLEKSEKKTQKAVVLSSAYGLHFFNTILAFKKPEKGDVVLVRLGHLQNRNSFQNGNILPVMFIQIIKDIVRIATLGIVKGGAQYSLLRVAAIENETITFSGKGIINSKKNDDAEFIPYIDGIKTITVPSKHVFLMGNRTYEIDSRYIGTFPLYKIQGKVWAFIGPIWNMVGK